MKKLTQKQIDNILELHGKWRNDIEGGIRADFSNKDLTGINLMCADLVCANLSGANLSGANFVRADLCGANLVCANLSGADLMYANLSGVDLVCANLSGANLSGANFVRANLCGANLSGADLVCANLLNIKEDFINKLSMGKNEVLGLYDYLMKGRMDGCCYEGECACFCGTIAKICDQHYTKLTNGIKPDSNSPTERWFLAIRKGDIPQNNQVSAITAQWMREFMDKEKIIYPIYEIVAIKE